MATLTVWTFDTAGGAEEAAATLVDLAGEQALAIRGAGTVAWEEGAKKPRTRQLHELGGPGALGGAFWGLLFGLIFFVPLLGAAIGAATGAFSGSLSDVGIDDAFVNRVRDQITPGTSGLFLLSSGTAVDLVKDALEPQAPSGVLFTNLDGEQEDALGEVFAD